VATFSTLVRPSDSGLVDYLVEIVERGDMSGCAPKALA
jgi:hypothetical protein